MWTPPNNLPGWGLQVQDGSFLMHDQSPGTYELQVMGNGPAAQGMSGRLEFTIKDENVMGWYRNMESRV